MRTVSVVIPSYRSSATLERSVRSVLGSRPSALKELLVVDSSPAGEMDACFESLRALGAQIVRLDKRSYPAEARNQGARRASGDVLAFLDSDAEAEPGWVDGVLENAARYRVGGGSIGLDPAQRWHPVALAQYFLQFNEFMPSAFEKSVPFVPSCNLYCERELFEKVGGFPDFRASEDVLFGRAVAGHAQMRFLPTLRVRHIFGLSLNRLWANQKLLGDYTLRYRRISKAGSVRYFRGLLLVVTLPLLWVYKWIVVIKRLWRDGTPTAWLQWLVSLPFFFLGLTAWMTGFAGACLTRGESEKKA